MILLSENIFGKRYSFLSADWYEKSSVGRASVQWGGRPRPPTDMAARDGPPHQSQLFFIFRCIREEMIVGMSHDYA
jgi:hypothetical protein